ncbi:MAG: hypothetical protein Q9219_006327 [cf. Caloplaca sp. 3 TL-2023]
MLSDYPHRLDNPKQGSGYTLKTLPIWHDFEPTSSPYHLPTRLHSGYEGLNEDYSHFSKGPITAREQGVGVQAFKDGNGFWEAQTYRPQLFDYPTPQSSFSLSPPQHVRRDFGSSDYDISGQTDRYPVPSGPAASHQLFDDMPESERSYVHQLRVSPLSGARSPWDPEERKVPPLDGSEDSDEDGSVSCEPYAQLIFRALKSAPGYRMVLKDIYRWFEENTDKAKKSSKGWQNSIRHNLSMNGAFRKVDQDPSTDEGKKGFIWVLEPSALVDGVKSTTRFRKSGSSKKTGKAKHPAPERQRSGAKGGKAARKAARLRHSARSAGVGPLAREDIPLPSIELPNSNTSGQPLTPSSMWTPDSLESFLSMASRPMTPMTSGQAMYDYGDIEGVTSMMPDGPLFPDRYGSSGIEDHNAFHSFASNNVVTMSSPGRTVYKAEP